MSEQKIRQLLESFGIAWAAKDVDAVVKHFSNDGVYFASVGPLPGERACGRRAIRLLVEKMFAVDDGAKASVSDLQISGSAAAWKWIYELPNGSVVSGCDIFEVRGEHITMKDAYRKITR